MSRRSPKRSTKALSRRVRKTLIECLEPRVLLSTVITDTDPLTPTPPTAGFEYKAADGQAVRVVVHGDVSAEFIFAMVKKGATIATLTGDPVSDVTPQGGTPPDGRDLFAVYVAQASIDSYISIAAVATPGQGTGPRPMLPFDGSVNIRMNPIRGTVTTTSVGGGPIILGARTRKDSGIDNFGDTPIRQAGFHGIGIAPDNAKHKLVAGLQTAPGVSLGRFMFGGTIYGDVNVQGSMESFYCGSLLTGVAEGQSTGTILDPNNFHIGGDIHNILVLDSVGTDALPKTADRDKPTYYTGTDIDVQGRVQMIKVGGDYVATTHIHNDLPDLGLRIRQQELEVRNDGSNRGQFTEFENGQFGDGQAFFNNDTFDTPQFVGSINSKQLGVNSVQLNGILQWQPNVNDVADFYALPLMGGQTVQVRLLSTIETTVTVVNKKGHIVHEVIDDKSPLHIGVFDPNDRLIATDWSNKSAETNFFSPSSGDVDPAQQEVFSITADRPGIYRLAVGLDAPNFSGGTPFIGAQAYQVQVTGVGNMGLGGMFVGGTVLAEATAASPQHNSITGDLADVEVVHGDLGALFSDDFLMSNSGVNALADGGDLRAIDAMSFGFATKSSTAATQGETGITASSEATFTALTGSVGMVRTRGTDSSECTVFNSFGYSLLHPIGGDLQWVVAPVILGADIIVDGSVGTIQAAQYGFDNYAGSIAVNADNKGKPGIIDLIDVTQNLGTLSAGGPTITTGPGGNVRYIHISASSTAFRSKVFGGSQPEETTYVQGQSADITDDSGAQVHITPTQENFIDPTTGLSANNSGTLTVLTYPIASSSTGLGGLGGPQTGTGSVIIRITSTRGMQVRVSGGSAEIGEIQSTGNGPALDFDLGPDGLPNTGDENNGPDGIPNTGDEPFELDPTLTANGNKPDNGIDLRGYGRNALIDVYSITGNNFDVIRNRTPGEIVNANIGSVGLLEANNLGWARSSLVKGLATEQATVVDIPGTADVEGNTFPFNGTTNGIILHAAAETQPVANQILARQSIGNILALGRVQEISANADGHGDHGIFEGIIGNVFVKGQMREVQIGEGLMPSGTGNMSRAGLYDICDFGDQGTLGMGRIEKVTNQGLNSDIRGDIITNSGIGQIGLTDGSIIDSDIMVSQTPGTDSTRTGLDVSSGLAFGTTADVIVHSPGSGNTLGNIDGITTSGRGGIIGLSTKSANLGPVNALGGFGVINSRFLILGDGRFAGNTADGYGYRGVEWFGGQSLDFVNARGNGKRLSTASFEPSVLLGNTMSIDPFFGTRPNELTDLNVVLGTTAANPVKKGTSASGSIDISDIRVSRDVGSIIANTIRSAGFSIGNNVGSISTRSYTDTVSFALGKVSSVNVGGDATRTSFGVAGPVGDVHIGGSFKGSSSFQATGQNGSIGSFVTDNTLYGNVYAQDGIGTIRVGTTYGSEGTRSAKNIGLFVVGGDFASNAILQVGSRSSDANGRLSKLVIEGDFQDGGLIQLNSLGANNVILGANQGTIDFKPWDS